jgi:hypothetical protein
VLISNWDKDYRRARNALPYNEVEVWPASAPAYDRPIANKLGEGYYHGGCVLWYCENRDATLEECRRLAGSMTDAVFLVQLGPVANVLIHQMFLANRANTYLDMGHSLDGILFGDAARPYMSGEDAAMCQDLDARCRW